MFFLCLDFQQDVGQKGIVERIVRPGSPICQDMETLCSIPTNKQQCADCQSGIQLQNTQMKTGYDEQKEKFRGL